MRSAGDVARDVPRRVGGDVTARRPVARSAALLLVVGVALGLAHNQAGLMGRPRRGIPWVAPKESPLASGPAEPAVPAESSRAPAATPTAKAVPSAPPAAASPPAASPSTVAVADHPTEIAMAEARRLLDADAALFIDARDPAEYEAGHIPGAIRMTRDDVLADPAAARALPVHGRPIITYCEGGECEASLDLAKALVGVGYRQVLVYAGGFPEWSAAGQPAARGSGK